jgi:lipopolysaccharide/colanic/teichoic acid biosynthesis glycosyltransferase
MKNIKTIMYSIAKRSFDIVFSFIVLILLLPFLCIIAISIKISSTGPVIYSWKVVGKNGSYFDSYKFRTMTADADSIKNNLSDRNEMEGPFFKISNDPRITILGHYLRKYSIDELPQFFSVLQGKMSIVGPRPPLQTEYLEFTDFQKKKMYVKPGITCLWQVEGRNEITDADEWIRKDLEYIRRRSFSLDLYIIYKTILTVFRGSGR